MPDPIILDGAIISVLKKEQNCHAICVWPLMHDKSKLVYVSLLPERSCNLNNHLAEKAGAPVQWLEWC